LCVKGILAQDLGFVCGLFSGDSGEPPLSPKGYSLANEWFHPYKTNGCVGRDRVAGSSSQSPNGEVSLGRAEALVRQLQYYEPLTGIQPKQKIKAGRQLAPPFHSLLSPGTT